MRQSVVVFVTEILLELATKNEILNYTSITSALYTGEIIRVERIFVVGFITSCTQRYLNCPSYTAMQNHDDIIAVTLS